MSLVFESSRQPPFLGEEGYPPIDQAGDEVDRYDEAEENNIGVGMSDVGDVNELAAVVAGGYHPPDSSILAESETSRLVADEVVGGGDEHHHHQVSSNMAATAAAASAAAQTHAKSKASARRISDDSSISPPHSMSETTSPIHGSAMASRMKSILKPDRDIYRNTQGKFQCTWPDCTEEAQEFARKCEYNKHMDKHERPYRCMADGCEKLPGFTYSGGLLRHEREVHNKHGGPRNPLHCPHPTCKRHAGKGFSRQENLNEHLRRVHTIVSPSTTGADLALDGGSALASLADLRPLAAVVDASGPGSNPATMSAAAAAAAAAVVSEALPSSVMRGDENDDDKTMEGLGLLTAHSHAQVHLRRRKRTASFLSGDVDDDHGHDDLREEVKRVRQENEELRERLRQQSELQNSQIGAMMKQIAHLEQQQQQQQQKQLQQQQQQQQPQQGCKNEVAVLSDALADNCSPA